MVDPRIIEQVLGNPRGRDVSDLPITRLMLLQDPSTAGQVAAYLTASGTRRSHALTVLALYDERALPSFLAATAALPPYARASALDVLHAMLSDLPPARLKQALGEVADGLRLWLEDATPMVVDRKQAVEVDFLGRVKDDTYIVLNALFTPDQDFSAFRRAEPAERDEEIGRFLRQLGGSAFV